MEVLDCPLDAARDNHRPRLPANLPGREQVVDPFHVSKSEPADALVAVHGLIDSIYLKELARKVKRGLAGQMGRGFSTGAMQYGCDKIPVFDPSGATDPDGRPVVLADVG